MKKLIHKIHSWLYEYHRAKMFKYFYKIIGAKRYNSNKLPKVEKKYMENDIKATINLYNAFYSGETHADMSSLYPNVMHTEKFPYKDTDSVKG